MNNGLVELGYIQSMVYLQKN